MSIYTPEIADTICEALADGESLRTICAAPDMPSKANVFRWLKEYPDFADQYERAREAQADSHSDDIVDIADNPELDPNDKRVRIDARKWLAGKLRPKKYGDKVALTGGNPATDNPVQLAIEATVRFIRPGDVVPELEDQR